MSAPRAPLLDVRDLRAYRRTATGVVRAVDGVSFSIDRGEAMAIVGESGSGKTVTCLSLLRLLPGRGWELTGDIRIEGRDLLGLSEREMRTYRGRVLSMVFQDPFSSLNPVLTIGDQIAASYDAHTRADRATAAGRVDQLLAMVGMREHHLRSSYPHQLSGGMRQRAVSAVAMAPSPKLLIADEPTTALDVTIQAAYLRMLRLLQRETGLSLLLITHDLAIVAQYCDRVAVMYAGRIVETGPVREVFSSPRHPYARALLDGLPSPTSTSRRLRTIAGEPPDALHRPVGCPFAPRCPSVMPVCRETYPAELAFGTAHTASCWLVAR